VKKQQKKEKRDADRRLQAEQAQAALPVSPTTGQRLKRSEYIKGAGSGGLDGGRESGQEEEHTGGVGGAAVGEGGAAPVGGSRAPLKPSIWSSGLMNPPPAAADDGILVDHLATRYGAPVGARVFDVSSRTKSYASSVVESCLG
jgi:hypothetical protein